MGLLNITMSAIFYITAALVAMLVALVVIQQHFICRLQRELEDCVSLWGKMLQRLAEIQQKKEDEEDWWKGK